MFVILDKYEMVFVLIPIVPLTKNNVPTLYREKYVPQF